MLVARHISCLQMKWNGIFQPDTISTHKHTSLVSDNMFLRFGFSRYLPVLVHWCGFRTARGESEWCMDYYCDVLLLKQLLPYICQVALVCKILSK